MEAHKALAEAEGRIKENRENEDINRRQMLLRLEEERKKLVEAIDATFRCVLASPSTASPLPISPAICMLSLPRFCAGIAGP